MYTYYLCKVRYQNCSQYLIALINWYQYVAKIDFCTEKQMIEGVQGGRCMHRHPVINPNSGGYESPESATILQSPEHFTIPYLIPYCPSSAHFKNKGDLNFPGNYRPVCLLSVFSKMFEKLISVQIYTFSNLTNFLLAVTMILEKNCTVSAIRIISLSLFHLLSKIGTMSELLFMT